MNGNGRRTEVVLREVREERRRQMTKHGDQSHLPDGTGGWWGGSMELLRRHGARLIDWAQWAKSRTQDAAATGTVTYLDILAEEVFEALAETDQARLRAELVQVAAVAVQWVETIDHRAAGRA